MCEGYVHVMRVGGEDKGKAEANVEGNFRTYHMTNIHRALRVRDFTSRRMHVRESHFALWSVSYLVVVLKALLVSVLVVVSI